MNLLKKLFAVQLLIICSIFFSCSDDTNDDVKNRAFPDEITGTWTFKSSESTWYYIFEKEGKGLRYRLVGEYDQKDAIFPLKYTYNNGSGTIIVEADGNDKLFKIDTDSYSNDQFTANSDNVSYSIKKQRASSDKSIIGKWEDASDSQEVIGYEFKKDGVLIETVTYNGEIESVSEQLYTYSKNMILTISYEEVGEQITDTSVVLDLSDSKMLIQTNEGQETWTKK